MDGKKATKVLRSEERFDAIFLDLFLPYIPGWELLDLIQQNPQRRETPVVIVSSAPISDRVRKELSRRVTAFVNKDNFNFETFESLVSDVLAAHDEKSTGEGES